MSDRAITYSHRKAAQDRRARTRRQPVGRGHSGAQGMMGSTTRKCGTGWHAYHQPKDKLISLIWKSREEETGSDLVWAESLPLKAQSCFFFGGGRRLGSHCSPQVDRELALRPPPPAPALTLVRVTQRQGGGPDHSVIHGWPRKLWQSSAEFPATRRRTRSALSHAATLRSSRPWPCRARARARRRVPIGWHLASCALLPATASPGLSPSSG